MCTCTVSLSLAMGSYASWKNPNCGAEWSRQRDAFSPTRIAFAMEVNENSTSGNSPMDIPTTNFVRAGSLEELKAEGRLVVRGVHRPILVVHDRGRIFALDNRCPHMGFPLDRGSVE